MGDTNPTILLIILIGLILAAVGLFVFIITALGGGGGRSKKSKSILGGTRSNAQTQTVSSPQAQKAGEPSTPADTTPDHPGEVMCIIRDQQTGRILVQVEGQQYAHIREIKDAQVGRRVLWAIADLLRFTGGMAANPQALQSIQRPEASKGAQPAARQVQEPMPTPNLTSTPNQAASPSVPPLAAPVAPRRSPKASAAQEPPEQKLNVGQQIGGFFQRGFQRTSSPPAITSFIDQVEAILQTKIEALPTPLPHDVHVKSGVDGALEIEVGPDVYNSPDEVPEPTIRKLIQDAVTEWESS
jgi:hypothetical protein